MLTRPDDEAETKADRGITSESDFKAEARKRMDYVTDVTLFNGTGTYNFQSCILRISVVCVNCSQPVDFCSSHLIKQHYCLECKSHSGT